MGTSRRRLPGPIFHESRRQESPITRLPVSKTHWVTCTRPSFQRLRSTPSCRTFDRHGDRVSHWNPFSEPKDHRVKGVDCTVVTSSTRDSSTSFTVTPRHDLFGATVSGCRVSTAQRTGGPGPLRELRTSTNSVYLPLHLFIAPTRNRGDKGFRVWVRRPTGMYR